MDKIKSYPSENLNELAIEVMKNYSIFPESIQIVQSDNTRIVWKVNSQGKVFCLKRLSQAYDKCLFSVSAQIYIKSNGGKVPGVILNLQKNPITIYNNQLFTLYEWIKGRDFNFSNSGDFCTAIQGLAEFHIASKGYTCTEASRKSSKLGKWPEQYASMINKLKAWKEVSLNNTASYLKNYVQVADSIIEIGNHSINLLNNSSYNKLTSPDSVYPVLNHQDFGKGNALLSEDGVYIIDLDGITFDLPIRDLRKIIGKEVLIRGKWDESIICHVLSCYEKSNPLSREEKNILYIDLLFPHLFYGLVKNFFLNNKLQKTGEIQKIANLELSKIPIINQLL